MSPVNVVLFIDCDNQSAPGGDDLLLLIEEEMGPVTCAFLVGNNHGESVRAWRRKVMLSCPCALVDMTVVPDGREAADTELIGKMFAFRSLFSTTAASVFVASRDANVVAAGKMLENAGFSVRYSDPRGRNKAGRVTHISPPMNPGNSNSWLLHLEGNCKTFTHGKRRFANLSDVGNALVSIGIDSKQERIDILDSIPGACIDRKNGRFYFFPSSD